MRAARWVSTVFTLTSSTKAISLVLLPSATICRISRCRAVSASIDEVSAPGARCSPATTWREIRGLRYISSRMSASIAMRSSSGAASFTR